MTYIIEIIAVSALILAFTALIFAFLGPATLKSGVLSEIAAMKVHTEAMKVEIDSLRRDVDAFNRDTYKKLADKHAEMGVELNALNNRVEQSETARKNWGNKWAPMLGKIKKELELPEGEEQENATLADTIPIPDDTIPPGYDQVIESNNNQSGFASLM